MSSQESLTLQEFCAAIPDLPRLSHSERTLVFLWYLNEFGGQERVRPVALSSCYRALSLEEPRNIHQLIAGLEKRRPRAILRDGQGLHLERRERDRLQDKYSASIRAAEAARRSATAEDSKADVAIIVALREEFAELHVQIPDWEPVPVRQTGGFDYTFAHPSVNPDRPYRCVVTFVGEMTHMPSAMETQRLLGTWRPATVVNLGIAGSLDDEVALGDIVVATVVDDYLARGKAVASSSEAGWEFELSGEPYRPSGSLARFASHLPFAHRLAFEGIVEHAGQELARLLPPEEISALRSREHLRETIRTHEGHLASGPVVAAATNFGQWLRKQRDRNYLAVEMEAAGVLAAVHRQLDPQHTLVVRGISDFGDERKKELDRQTKGAFRVFAMRNCIRFLFAMMRVGAFPLRTNE